MSNKRDGWRGSVRWGLTSSRPEPKVLSAAKAAIVAKEPVVCSGTQKQACLYCLKFKESKLLELQRERCLAIWEDPDDGLLLIFIKVYIFLDVKDSLINSKCPLKALKVSKLHPVRPLDSWGKERGSQPHWLGVSRAAEPQDTAELVRSSIPTGQVHLSISHG